MNVICIFLRVSLTFSSLKNELSTPSMLPLPWNETPDACQRISSEQPSEVRFCPYYAGVPWLAVLVLARLGEIPGFRIPSTGHY